MTSTRPLIVTHFVSIGSRSGAYGGPFDTAVRQALLSGARGAQVTVLCGHLAGDAPAKEDVGCELVAVPVRRWFGIPGFTGLFSVRLAFTAARHIWRSDVVHLSLGRELGPLWVMLVAVILRKPWVAQPHGMLTSRTSRLHRLVDLVVLPLVRRASQVLALTDREWQQLDSWSSGRLPAVTVLGNPVALPADLTTEPRHHSAVPQGSADILWVARLHSRKRVQTFLDAARISGRGSGRWNVLGPDGGELELVEDAVRAGHVFYEGAVPGAEVAHRVARADVFVLTSESEPWGNVLAQALALGVPTVLPLSAALAGPASSYGAALTYRDGDAAELATQVGRVLSDAALRRSLASGCQALSRQLLDDDHQRSQLAALYERLAIRGRGASHRKSGR